MKGKEGKSWSEKSDVGMVRFRHPCQAEGLLAAGEHSCGGWAWSPGRVMQSQPFSTCQRRGGLLGQVPPKLHVDVAKKNP